MELAWFLTGLSYWGLSASRIELAHLEACRFRNLQDPDEEPGRTRLLRTSVDVFESDRHGSRTTAASRIRYIRYMAMAQFSKAYRHEEAASVR